MKNRIRVSALLLVLCLLVSLASCDLVPPDLSDWISLDGTQVHDPDFVPQEIPDFMVTEFGEGYAEQLSPNERAIFDAICAALPGQNFFTVTLAQRLEVCKGAPPTEKMQEEALASLSEWILNALSVIRLEMPELFWLDTGFYNLSAAFTADAKGIYHIAEIELTVRLKSESHLTTGLTKHAGSNPTIERQWINLQNAANSLVLQGETVAERVAEIDRFICNRTEYDLNAPNRDGLVGVLLDGRAVCEGYAQTFLYLCKRAGIPCINIIGQGVSNEGAEGHMWSAVRIEDTWYVTDVTWNDTTNSKSFLLVGLSSSYGGMTFLASHIAENSLGESKEFLLPMCSELPYQK